MSLGHPLIFQKSLGSSLHFLKNSPSVSYKPSLMSILHVLHRMSGKVSLASTHFLPTEQRREHGETCAAHLALCDPIRQRSDSALSPRDGHRDWRRPNVQ